jgi:hypothetical protein
MEEIFNKKIEIDTSILIGEIDNYDLIDKLIVKVKEGLKNSKVSRKTNVTAEHTEFTHLEEDPNFHKFLKIIQPSIYKIYKNNFNVREVWGNVYNNKNDFAKLHGHDANAFSGILYCTDGPGPGTYFPQYDLLIKEKKGRFVLFNEKLLHEVKSYDYKKERVTIAFNFFEIKDWGNSSNYYWVNKDDKEIIL